MGVIFRSAAPGVGVSLVGARLDAGLRAIPAHISTFVFICETLGTYHHHVADGQRAVHVAALARTDGAHAGLVAASLGNNGTAGDGEASARKVVGFAFPVTTSNAGTVTITVGIDLAAVDGDVSSSAV